MKSREGEETKVCFEFRVRRGKGAGRKGTTPCHLRPCVRNKAFTMASSANSANMESLLDTLERLRNAIAAKTPSTAGVASIDSLFQQMKGLSKDRLVEIGVLDVALEAMRKDSCSGNCHHRAVGIVCEIMLEDCEDEDEPNEANEANTSRVEQVSEKQGLERIIGVMKAHPTDAFLLLSCLFTSFIAIDGTTTEKRAQFAAMVADAVVVALETNEERADAIFDTACNIVGSCFGPGARMAASLLQRAAQCVFQGVIWFKDDQDAQNIGHHLLVHLVGQEAAMAMIEHAELAAWTA